MSNRFVVMLSVVGLCALALIPAAQAFFDGTPEVPYERKTTSSAQCFLDIGSIVRYGLPRPCGTAQPARNSRPR